LQFSSSGLSHIMTIIEASIYFLTYFVMTLSFELSEKYTLVLNNTRELDRVPKYKMSTLYTNHWWSMLHSFSPTLMTICLPWGQHILTMLYDIIISRTFYIVLLHHISMWHMWQWPCHDCDICVTVTCDVTFCLLYLCSNKKKTQNKIKENKINSK